MTKESDKPERKALIDSALRISGNSDRYHRRMQANPNLIKLGSLPLKLADISNQMHPWYCHGLAFRMATYSDVRDNLFDRWERLLTLAQHANGWGDEYENWCNADDHWAIKWDKFHQFLWLLQCYEHFSRGEYTVTFPGSGPDLLVKRPGHEDLYVECYFYSKWWHRENFIKEVLCKIDPNIYVERVYNTPIDPSCNPFTSDHQLVGVLSDLSAALTPDGLEKLKSAADFAYPKVILRVGDVEFLLDGDGEYLPSPNAHGDPAYSWPVFLKEIIKAKQSENNLSNSRPNIVMVNALGIDFQVAFAENMTPSSPDTEWPNDIDELWVCVCGIDASLHTNSPIRKFLRHGYAGSSY